MLPLPRLPVATLDALTDAFEAFVAATGPACRMSADELLVEIWAGTIILSAGSPTVAACAAWLEASNEAWERAEDAEQSA